MPSAAELPAGFRRRPRDGSVVRRAFNRARAVAAAAERELGSAARGSRAMVTRALGGEGLAVVFQPIVSLRNGQVVGVEALARFVADPSGQGPAFWFDEASRLGMGVDLEIAAIARAVADFEASGPDEAWFLSVNASPGTLLSRPFAELLARGEFPNHRLMVELTEHAEVGDYDVLTACTDRLRRLGVRVAVDDAGAGYSSLRHILRLRPDVIKLDRALVDSIDDDPARRALATALGDFGRQIGASVVGEGVETADELRALQACGIPLAQGFFIARPAPPPVRILPAAMRLASLRIVLADDDPAARALFAQLLERAGHEVVQAADGLEAVDLATECQPDVVVLDRDMPHLGAAGAAPILRQVCPRARIVVVSASDPDSVDRAEAWLAVDADARLSKRDALAALPALLGRLVPSAV